MESQRYCVQCGNSIQPGGRFCGRCGAPAEQPAVPSEAEGQIPIAHPSATLTGSDVVYLHGEHFVDKDNWRTEGITLESSGAKVQKEALVDAMVLAAIASLVKDGWIEVAMINVGFLLPSKAPVLRGLLPAPYIKGGLEGALFAALHKHEKMNSVEQVLIRLVGGERDDPWEEIAARVRAHLADTGYFRRVDNPAAHGLGKLFHAAYRYEPNATLISNSTGEAVRVRSTLAEVQSRDPRTWEQVEKQVRRAIKACQAKDKNDD